MSGSATGTRYLCLGGSAASARALGALLVLLSVLAGCRNDMHVQPRVDPLEQSTFFEDSRSARPVIEDTVARGHLKNDELLYTGKQMGQVADSFPFAITRQDLDRGRERFNIHCSPCHGRAGNADGMIVQRGFSPPPSFHTENLRKAPVGHFFDVMTNGFGRMPTYAPRVSVQDRWRIIAYIRALQLSQQAAVQDVPESDRAKLQEQAQ